MILVKTHIEVDQPSPHTGIIYSREILDGLVESEISAPGAFDVNIDKMTLEAAVNWVKIKNNFSLIGFDLINDVLYLKLEATESIAERINSNEYITRLLVGAVKENDEIVRINDVKGVVLQKAT